MKTNLAAASYRSRILSPKYGQTGNVKPFTANRNLPFAVKRPNLDLKVSNIKPLFTAKEVDNTAYKPWKRREQTEKDT